MGFYFVVHVLMGLSAGAAAWTLRRAKEEPSNVPAWVLGEWGWRSAVFAALSAIAAVITTLASYPAVWALATIVELILGAIVAGFIPIKVRILLTAIAIPLNVIILGALWGFWYL